MKTRGKFARWAERLRQRRRHAVTARLRPAKLKCQRTRATPPGHNTGRSVRLLFHENARQSRAFFPFREYLSAPCWSNDWNHGCHSAASRNQKGLRIARHFGFSISDYRLTWDRLAPRTRLRLQAPPKRYAQASPPSGYAAASGVTKKHLFTLWVSKRFSRTAFFTIL